MHKKREKNLRTTARPIIFYSVVFQGSIAFKRIYHIFAKEQKMQSILSVGVIISFWNRTEIYYFLKYNVTQMHTHGIKEKKMEKIK